ncbi:hypothetical protein JL09_g6767, partial [Pichia kudriavzevii]
MVHDALSASHRAMVSGHLKETDPE